MPSQSDKRTESAPEPPFELGLERLEAIVDGLEGGDLALEEALARFEEGVQLTRQLGEQLTRAEQRVDVLLEQGAGLVERPFDAPEDDE